MPAHKTTAAPRNRRLTFLWLLLDQAVRLRRRMKPWGVELPAFNHPKIGVL